MLILLHSLTCINVYFYLTPQKCVYDQDIRQSHTAEQPTDREEEPQNTDRHKTPGRQLKQSNQLSLPHQDDRIT